MRSEMITTTATRDDIELILSALSAYNHNTRYRMLYERLRDQAAVMDQQVAGEKRRPRQRHTLNENHI